MTEDPAVPEDWEKQANKDADELLEETVDEYFRKKKS